MMKIRQWFNLRGPKFIFRRLAKLINRYGFTSTKGTKRVQACVDLLSLYGCKPTLPTPGKLVEKHSGFLHRLQEEGVEITVHSYDHIDLAALSYNQAVGQLKKAISVFNLAGVNGYGFRCPYLRHTDELLEQIPEGLFKYSSNKAIHWIDTQDVISTRKNNLYTTIEKFYQPKSYTESLAVPYTQSNFIEIPVSTPDDLQLYDGLGLDSEGIGQAWIAMLAKMYQRGEHFNLIFHPELADICSDAFISLFEEARQLFPHVWIAKLSEISDWWSEKASDRVEISRSGDHLSIKFICNPRSTLLAKNIWVGDKTEVWMDGYVRIYCNTLHVPASPRPFLGISEKVPFQTLTFLMEQGYILELGEVAKDCGIYLDSTTLSEINNDLELINWIERQSQPLIRFWRWPNGARSALSVTGDLDALSLLDYASRLFV